MTTVKIYNQSIGLDTDDFRLKEHLAKFIADFYTQPTTTFSKSPYAATTPDKVFANKILNETSYIFHRNQFIHLLSYLEMAGYDMKQAEKIDLRNYEVATINTPVREGWVPYAKQELAIDFLVDNPRYSKLLPTQTGSGKSLMSMVTLSRKGLRTGICILPSYIEKTIIDMVKILEIDSKDIMVIQGSKSLGGLIDMAKEGEFNSPFTIFSSSTMSNFNKGYEEDKEFTLAKYGISPIELFPLLKIGVMLIDETHQHFHIVFKQILNSNVKQLIGMSATFISDDPFIKRMQALLYPQDGIYRNFGHVRYIDIYSISYSVNPDFQKFIRTNEFGSTFYSHTAYEQSIHKNPYLRKRYYNLIRTTLDDYFLSEYKQGDRFAVFVSTVVMATEVTEYLKEAYPLLDIRRYCESDPYENLTDPDGRVTTVISAGTNKDIKKLRVVVNTISISSSASNLQLIGRLRELEGLDVKFCQLFNDGLRKHHDYKAKRAELFKGKVKDMYERRSRVSV